VSVRTTKRKYFRAKRLSFRGSIPGRSKHFHPLFDSEFNSASYMTATTDCLKMLPVNEVHFSRLSIAIFY